jgi:SAM-dependent methyltransferase
MLMLARERVPATCWIGSDYVRGPLDDLSHRLMNVPLLQFDLRDCPLPDNSVDSVLMLNVLEHIDDDARAMQHVRRVLRPGGVAVIEVPAGPELYDVYDELLMHYRRYTARGLRSLIQGCGLEVVRFTHLGALLYPAFYVVKRRNRRFLSREAALKREVVAKEIRRTRASTVLSVLLGTELALGRHMTWPFGIRCAAVGRKSGF